MFSEYASRFLAQSQSRLGFDDANANAHAAPATNTNISDSYSRPMDPSSQRQRFARPSASSARAGSRSYLQRPSMLSNPYGQASSQFVSRFPFASRTMQAREAPLFYSATDEFREEDDAEEREREVADYYALQRSRRHFSVEKLSESDEMVEGEEDEGGSGDERTRARKENALSHHYVGKGIRSSWRGERRKRGRPPTVRESVMEGSERETSTATRQSETTQTTDRNGKDRLVDVELASSRRSSLDSIDPEEAASAIQDDDPENPPPFQTFRGSAKGIAREHRWIPEETDEETAHLNPHPRLPSPDRESVPDMVTSEHIDAPPRHDWFWGQLFWICLASLFATSLLVWLHTDAPSRKKPLGDSIYAVLSKSFHLLAVDTLIALIVSAVWLALLRSYIRPLTFLTLIAVPVILFSFSIYTLVSSYKGYWHGARFQDKAMRFLAFGPMVGTGMWCYLAYKARHSLDRAIRILEFACGILAQSPALQLVGFVSQAVIVAWYWIWLSMFTRVFLKGRFSASSGRWILPVGTWWLGAWHVLMLLWVLSVVSGVQRAVAAATTSQWYFHRSVSPAPTSRQVVLASLHHATTQLFGTIAHQAFLAVAVRVPILVLPRAVVTWVTMCFYSIIPSPVAALTNPLTLTYAAIHSQPLSVAARQLSNLPFVARTEATTTLSPNTASAPQGDVLTQWRMAKLILHAFRYILTISMGFGGWVSTARLVQIDPGYRGSLYAYVIGLSAAAVGWSVFGAVENVIVGVVDASVVCWASEIGSGSGGVRYCREAGELFGEEKGWDYGGGERDVERLRD